MGKIRNNQSGFSAVEALLALIFVAIVVFIGVYVAHNRNDKTTATATTTTSTKKATISTPTPKTHTAQEATTFTQQTYDDFLAAINNAGTDNTQPLGVVGLNAVKDNLTADFYTKAAASHNAGDFSCAAQFGPSKYTASLASNDKTTATVSVSIGIDDQGGTSSSGPLTATVDLASLKITAVTCPN